MAKNVLETHFVFNDADFVKVDVVRNKLTATNNDLNSLGRNSLVGTNIANSLKPAETAFDSLKNKVETSIHKPTISRYWETEARSVVASLKTVETAFAKTQKSLNNPGADSLKRIAEFGQQNTNPFGKADNQLFKDVEKTRNAVLSLNNVRLNNGLLDGLTQASVRLHDQLGKVQTQIKAVNKELSKTNDKNKIQSLNQDLDKLNTTYDKLNSKAALFEKRQFAAASAKPDYAGLQNYGALANQFTPAEVEPLVNTGLQAAEIAKLGTASLAVFGAVAAVGYIIVDQSKKIREESEKRLKNETFITAAMNRQALAQKNALTDFQEQTRLAEQSRKFSQFLGQGNINDLQTRKKNLEVTKSFSAPEINGVVNPNYQNITNEIQQLDAQIDAVRQKNKSLADDAFNNRWDIFKKNQEDRIKSEQKFQIEIEKGIDKVNDLGKTYKSVFAELSQKQFSDNPFVRLLSDADNSLKTLRENLKGLPKDLQSAAIVSQQNVNSNALFETRLNNNLAVYDLKDTANRFRNAGSTEDNKRFVDDVVKNDISRGNFFPNFGGTYGSDLANKAGGFDKLDDTQKRDIYEVSQLGTLLKDEKDNPLNAQNNRTFVSALARERVAANDLGLNQPLNERLQDKINIINSDVTNDSQRAIADKQLLALGGTLDPSQIRGDLREQIAASADREAGRKVDSEKEALDLRKQEIEATKKLTQALDKLTEVAGKGGLEGLNKYLEITVKGDNVKDVQGWDGRASQNDVAETYGQYFD